jgi:hypothetical protein
MRCPWPCTRKAWTTSSWKSCSLRARNRSGRNGRRWWKGPQPEKAGHHRPGGEIYPVKDAYLSIAEALVHGGFFHNTTVDIRWVPAEDLEKEDPGKIPGGGTASWSPAVLVTGASKARSRPSSMPGSEGFPFWASAWACTAPWWSMPAMCWALPGPIPPSFTRTAPILSSTCCRSRKMWIPRGAPCAWAPTPAGCRKGAWVHMLLRRRGDLRAPPAPL